MHNSLPLKQWPINRKDKVIGSRPMRPADVKNYFRGTGTVARAMGRSRGGWCDRCGVLIGGHYTTEQREYHYITKKMASKIIQYAPINRVARRLRSWCLCEDCYKYKTNPKSLETTPDIEDAERLGVNIGQMISSLMLQYAKNDSRKRQKDEK